MRIVVVGAGGMLGQDMVDVLTAREHAVRGTVRADLDVTDAQAVGRALVDADAVVNCVAWTAVDDAETHEAEAFAVNAVGPAVLARAAAERGVRLVHISTDYVFDGRHDLPYDEDALPRPRSAYGRTKLAGEWAVQAYAPDHLIVRTAWLYGARGRCFPRTIARAAVERGSLEVVDDQVGQPTWTRDLADLVERLLVAEAPSGTYHGTSAGKTSWHGFARAVVSSAGLDPEIVTPVTSDGYQRLAPRPAWSVLGHEAFSRAGVEPLGDWAQGWRRAAPEVLAELG